MVPSCYARITISFFTVVFLISTMTAFQFKTGKCPEVREMKSFNMNRFKGIWHVIQGTLTGYAVECITFNLTEKDSNHCLTQMPHNLSSELTVVDSTAPSKMNIKVNATSDAEFHVLVTDYDNFAGFFICKNNLDGNFQRAAAILSRTKTISPENHKIVKQRFYDYGIYDEDLTIVIECD